MHLQSIKEAINHLTQTMTTQQWDQFAQYASYINKKNQVMNLTAIDDPQGIYEKHFYDSLLMFVTLDEFDSFCDLGSGAGFPGMVVAIMRPESKITLVEPLAKRCVFLQEVVELLNLTNVEIVNERAEDLAVFRESFDVVAARAVSKLNILVELGLPLVKVGGYLVAMKAAAALDEAAEAKQAIGQCGGKLHNPQPQYLLDGSIRYNIKIEKIKQTPARFPRRYSQIKKKPL